PPHSLCHASPLTPPLLSSPPLHLFPLLPPSPTLLFSTLLLSFPPLLPSLLLLPSPPLSLFSLLRLLSSPLLSSSHSSPLQFLSAQPFSAAASAFPKFREHLSFPYAFPKFRE